MLHVSFVVLPAAPLCDSAPFVRLMINTCPVRGMQQGADKSATWKAEAARRGAGRGADAKQRACRCLRYVSRHALKHPTPYNPNLKPRFPWQHTYADDGDSETKGEECERRVINKPRTKWIEL